MWPSSMFELEFFSSCWFYKLSMGKSAILARFLASPGAASFPGHLNLPKSRLKNPPVFWGSGAETPSLASGVTGACSWAGAAGAAFTFATTSSTIVTWGAAETSGSGLGAWPASNHPWLAATAVASRISGISEISLISGALGGGVRYRQCGRAGLPPLEEDVVV